MPTSSATLFGIFSEVFAARGSSFNSNTVATNDTIVSAATRAGNKAWEYCHTGTCPDGSIADASSVNTVYTRSDDTVAFLVMAVHSGMIPASAPAAPAAVVVAAAATTTASGAAVPAPLVAAPVASIDNTLAAFTKGMQSSAARSAVCSADAADSLRAVFTVMLKAFAAVPWCSFLVGASTDIKQLMEKEGREERSKGILGSPNAPLTMAATTPSKKNINGGGGNSGASATTIATPSSIWAALPPPPRRPTMCAAVEAELAKLSSTATTANAAAASTSSSALPPLIKLSNATATAPLPMITSDATVKALCGGLMTGSPIVNTTATSASTAAEGSVATAPTPATATAAADAIVTDWFTTKVQQLYRPRRVDQMYRSSLLLLPKGPIVAAANVQIQQQQAASAAGGAAPSSSTAGTATVSQLQYRSSVAYIQCEAITTSLEQYLATLAAASKCSTNKQQQKGSSSSSAVADALRNLRAACGLFINPSDSATTTGGSSSVPSYGNYLRHFLPTHPVTFFWCCLSTMLTPTTSTNTNNGGNTNNNILSLAGMDLVTLYQTVFNPQGAMRDERFMTVGGGDDASDNNGMDDGLNDDSSSSSSSSACAKTQQRLVGALTQACSLMLSELFGLSMGALRQLYFLQKPRAAVNVTTNIGNNGGATAAAGVAGGTTTTPIISTQQVWFAEHGRMAPHFQVLKLVEGIVSDLLIYPPALATSSSPSAAAPTAAATAASRSPSLCFIPPCASPLVLPLHVRTMLFVELHTRIDEILIACGHGAYSANVGINFAAAPMSSSTVGSSNNNGTSAAAASTAAVAVPQVAANYSIPVAKLDAALTLSLSVPYLPISGAPIQAMGSSGSPNATLVVGTKSLVSSHLVHGLQQWARISESTLLYAATANASSCVGGAGAGLLGAGAAGGGNAANANGGNNNTNNTASSNLAEAAKVPKLPTGERFFTVEHPCPAPLLPTATVQGNRYVAHASSGVTVVGNQIAEPTWGEYFNTTYAAPVSGASVAGVSSYLTPFAGGVMSAAPPTIAGTVPAVQHANVVSQMPLFAKVWPLLFFSEMLQRGLFAAAASFAEGLMGPSANHNGSTVSTATTANTSSLKKDAAVNLLSQYISSRYTGSSSVHLNLFLFPTRTASSIAYVLPAAAQCAALNLPQTPSQQIQQQNNSHNDRRNNYNNNSNNNNNQQQQGNTTHTTPFVHSFVSALEDIVEGPNDAAIVPTINATTTIVSGVTTTVQTASIPPFAAPNTSAMVFNAQAQIASILEKQIIGKILSVAAGPSAVASNAAAATTAASTSTAASAAATVGSSPREVYNEVYTQLCELLPLLAIAQSYVSAPTLVSNFFEALAVMVRVEGQLNYFDFVVANGLSELSSSAAKQRFAEASSAASVTTAVRAVKRQLSYLLSPAGLNSTSINSNNGDAAASSTTTAADAGVSAWKWALLACELFVSFLTPALRKQRSPSLPLLDAMEELLMALEEPHVVTMRPQKMATAFAVPAQLVTFTPPAAAAAAASSSATSVGVNVFVRPSGGSSTLSGNANGNAAAAANNTASAVQPIFETKSELVSQFTFWSALASTVIKNSAGAPTAAAQLTPSAAIVRTATERILLQLLRERVPAWFPGSTAASTPPNLLAIFNASAPSDAAVAPSLASTMEAMLAVLPQFTPPAFVTADLFSVPAVFIGDRFKSAKAMREGVADAKNPFLTKRSLRDREKFIATSAALEFATLRYPHDHVRYLERSTLFNQCLRRVTSDNVHQYNLTLRTVILSEPVLVISKLISQALGNDDIEVTFCQAQLLQGVPRAILRTFVVMAIDRMFAIAAEEQRNADQQVKLLGSLIAFVWAQNANSFGSLSFTQSAAAPTASGAASSGGGETAAPSSSAANSVPNGRSGCAAYIFRRMLRALQTNRTSTVLFVCELLHSLLLHMLHESLECEETYTHAQLNALSCLPTSRWYASAASDSFLLTKWFDPQTMLLKKGGSGAAAGNAAANAALLSGPLGGGGGVNNMMNNNHNNFNNNNNNMYGGHNNQQQNTFQQQQTAQLMAARDAEKKAAADDAAAFGFMSSVFSTATNMAPVSIAAFINKHSNSGKAAGAVQSAGNNTKGSSNNATGAGNKNNAVGGASSASASMTAAAFSYLNFIFSASFSPLTLYQCRVRFCNAMAEPLDLNRLWATAVKNTVALSLGRTVNPANGTLVVTSASAASSSFSVQLSTPDMTTVGESLIGLLTTLQTSVYSLYSDYPGASIERELSLAATYFNQLNDLVLALVSLNAHYGGGGIMRHEEGKGYQYFNAASAAASQQQKMIAASAPHADLVGTVGGGRLRIPPVAASFPHIYNRCLLLLKEGRGENATATTNFKSNANLNTNANSGKTRADDASSAAVLPLAVAASRVSNIVWSLSLADLAYSEGAYITAIRQLLLFVRQAMLGRTEATDGSSSSATANVQQNNNSANNGQFNSSILGNRTQQQNINNKPAATNEPAFVTTATGGKIPAATAAAIAAMTSASAIDRAAMEADAELIEYIAGQERLEEERLKSLFSDKAMGRSKNDSSNNNNANNASDSVNEGYARGATTAAAATTPTAIAATGGAAKAAGEAASSEVASPTAGTAAGNSNNADAVSLSSFLFPSTIAVVKKVLAAKWLRLEQKVSIRLLLEQKDRIVAESRHHAKLMGVVPTNAASPPSTEKLSYCGIAVAELYDLLFVKGVEVSTSAANADGDDAESCDNAKSLLDTTAAASSPAAARHLLHTTVAHDILCPRTLLSTRDALAMAALIESLYTLHMKRAAEKAESVAKLMKATNATANNNSTTTSTTSSSSSSVNVDEIIRQGATEKAEQEFLGLLYTYITALMTFLPSYTDAEARRAAAALQRILVLLHKSKLQRSVSQFVQLQGVPSAGSSSSAAAASAAAAPAEKKNETTAAPATTAAVAPAASANSNTSSASLLSLSAIQQSTSRIAGAKRAREDEAAAAAAAASPVTANAPAALGTNPNSTTNTATKDEAAAASNKKTTAVASATASAAASPMATALAPTPMDAYLLQLFVQILSECSPERVQREDGSATILRNVFHVLGMLKLEVGAWDSTAAGSGSGSGGQQLHLAMSSVAALGTSAAAGGNNVSSTASSSSSGAGGSAALVAVEAFTALTAETVAPLPLFPSCPSHIRQLLAVIKRHSVKTSAQFAAASAMIVSYSKSLAAANAAAATAASSITAAPQKKKVAAAGDEAAQTADNKRLRTEGNSTQQQQQSGDNAIAGGGGGRARNRNSRGGRNRNNNNNNNNNSGNGGGGGGVNATAAAARPAAVNNNANNAPRAAPAGGQQQRQAAPAAAASRRL